MVDTSVTKVHSQSSPRGAHGERYLAAGVRLAMRMWEEKPGGREESTSRDYEVVGYVLEGRAELHLEGQMVILEPGDSYVVPRGARHSYRILTPFKAIEATTPPFHVHGRDLPR